jgi:branched-chain amino acid transport system ATP-binding protein
MGTASFPSAIVATGVRKSYGDHVVLDGIDLHVPAGTIFSLLGPNGAGKTTVLLTVAGVLPRLAGSVSMNGVRIDGWSASRRARRGLAVIPDDRALIPSLTVAESLKLVRAKLDPWELFPELERLADRKTGLLSGGEQQMLAVARSLASQPGCLLVDELSQGLAPIVVQRLLPVLRSAADSWGAAVVVVDQHVKQALTIADRAIVLVNGDIVLQERSAHLLEHPDLLEASYLGDRVAH